MSSADNYWPEMHDLMMHSTTSPTRSMRVQAVINHPHIADWYFTVKLSDFIEQWLYEALGAEWHWYRFEYQARGSTHAHGCAKLKNDPGICSLVQKAALGWLVEQELEQTDTAPSPEQVQALQCGEDASTLVLQYADWLVTTCNPSLPDDFGAYLNHILAQFHLLNWKTLIVTTLILSTQYNATHNAVQPTVYERKPTKMSLHAVLVILFQNKHAHFYHLKNLKMAVFVLH